MKKLSEANPVTVWPYRAKTTQNAIFGLSTSWPSYHLQTEAKFQLPKFEDAQAFTFNFSFTSCFLSLFLSLFLFSFAGHLLAFILVMKVSGKLLVSQDLMEGKQAGSGTRFSLAFLGQLA